MIKIDHNSQISTLIREWPHCKASIKLTLKWGINLLTNQQVCRTKSSKIAKLTTSRVIPKTAGWKEKISK